MKEIPLTGKHGAGKTALVDDGDYDLLIKHRWVVSKASRGISIAARIEGKWVSMYRFILGATDPKLVIDHIDVNRLNMQRSNLRQCTHAENSRNRLVRANKKGSKYKGVIFKGKRWEVSICVNAQVFYLGTYDSEDAAAIAYNKGAIKYHGEFANLNIVDSLPENLTPVTNDFVKAQLVSYNNSTSKYKGVHWDKNSNKWKATITRNKKMYYLGIHESEVDAALAYNEAAKAFDGLNARLNLIE